MSRWTVVVVAAALALAAPGVLAQEEAHEPAPVQEPTPHAEEPAAEPAHEHGVQHGDPAHGEHEHAVPAHDHEAHEEAAHEATAHGDAAHGAATHGEGDHAEHASQPWAAIIVNTVLFFGALAFLLGKPARAFLRQRKATIASSLAAAETARIEAQQKLAEVDRQLSGLEEQVAEILATATRTAHAEKARILATAQDEAARILQQAEAQVGDVEADAARRLRTLAANLAVDAAREIVQAQLGPDDRARLFDRYLKSLQKAAQ